MLIHLICAARPNFMKVAPLYHALKKQRWAEPVIVHTGQHYDHNMSGSFFEELGLPTPDVNLGVGSGTHAEQTGNVMISYEKVLAGQRPDLVVVVGDVNSTMAVTIAASKLGVRVAHLEAGLRSFDRRMPEEINRIVTDALADMLWTPSRDADENLLKEGVPAARISMVGNIMIDSLEMLREKIEKERSHLDFGLQAGSYGVVTIHRPSNVDEPAVLAGICAELRQIAERIPLVFPVHPRTRLAISDNGILTGHEAAGRFFLPEPLDYVRFMNLVLNSRLVITDSGGIQEETSYLDIPCLTVRENTERPITITHGTNQLCRFSELKGKVEEILCGRAPQRKELELWDGKTAYRVVDILRNACPDSRAGRSHA